MERSAATSADEGGRLGADTGCGCHAESVAGAWPPRGGRVLTLSGRGAGERRGAARSAGQTRAGLLWAKERWAGAGGGRCCRPSRLRPWAEKRGGGPRKEKSLFEIMFSINFQIPVFKYHFEQENDIF